MESIDNLRKNVDKLLYYGLLNRKLGAPESNSEGI